jgi:hypothetical protein
MPAVFLLGLSVLCFAASEWVAGQEREERREGGPATPPPARREPQRSLTNDNPPLFFREDWKLDPTAPNVHNEREPEHPIVQGDVVNPNLEVRLYGHKEGTRMVDQTWNDHLLYVMTLLCESNCAITLRDKNNDVDLTGLATIKWRTRVSGFHYLRPIVKLASGQWLVGDRGTAGPQTSWADTEIQLIDVRWRTLEMDNVVEGRDGYWVDWPDLSRVEEIGFTDLMRGSGHGSGGGSRLDWIEVRGKPVPRTASRTTNTSR